MDLVEAERWVETGTEHPGGVHRRFAATVREAYSASGHGAHHSWTGIKSTALARAQIVDPHAEGPGSEIVLWSD